MTTDRRNYPRLNAPVYWRSPGLGGPRWPVVDVGLGGMRVWSDDPPPIGARLQLELWLPEAGTVEILARVVRVDRLPDDAPARCDVALEFMDVAEDARERLEAALAESAP